MRVLVTGGAGFIGSNLVFALLGAAHDVGVIDDLSTGHMENIHPAAWFRKADILAPSAPGLVAEFGPEVVVHLAAQVDVARSIAEPDLDRAVNVDGTRRVAVAAREAGARRILSASSAAVYGEPEVVPLPERARKSPENPYGASKLEAEGVIAGELRGSACDFASLRFANVFGPRQDWRGEGGVVAIFAGRMTSGQVPVIYGDGRQTRDFIYVGDVVSAIITMLEHEGALANEGDDGPAYNVSTGGETSVEELATAIRAASAYAGPIEHAPAREGDVERSALDPSKLHAATGWKAGVPLVDGVANTVRWFRGRA